MKRRFVKMHGLGNDFVLLDGDAAAGLGPADLAWIADRRRGIGCDQVLVVSPEAGSWGYRVFNADGSPAGQCGNGARCVARRLYELGRIRDEDTLQGPGGPVAVAILDEARVRVDLGEPRLDPGEIPFRGPAAPEPASVEADGRRWSFLALSMGNPHAVVRVEDLAAAPLAAVGRALQGDDRFPEGVNVGMLERADRGAIGLRVFERGVGETPACGSGACAAVVAGRLAGWLDARVRVRLPGGQLEIAWPGPGSTVTMTGPADHAFEGEFDR